MARRRLLVSCGAIGALALTSVGGAAGQDSQEPVVTAISPAKPSVGQALVIRGRRFVPGVRRNTVVFRSPRGRSVFVKADRATARKLTVTLPTSLEPLMGRRPDGSLEPTRFRLRVLAGRFGRVTAPRLSPLVGPAEL